MRQLIKTFKALSDANRIRIIKMLMIRPLCVCEITDILNLASSTVSKHLSILRDAGFITDSKDGKWVNYQINEANSDEYIGDLLPLIRNWLLDDQIIRQDEKRVRQVDRYTICGM
ncbi:MAG: winged helix-turn-helix transcriptional regulator [Syntrophaceae bacterium]|nr:winged helix-turn-helix transcriptional regulator [Syntrophaceae bacterium]